MFRGSEIFLRLDTGQGRGHHEHVRTAGIHSKFGIPLFELDEVRELALNNMAFELSVCMRIPAAVSCSQTIGRMLPHD